MEAGAFVYGVLQKIYSGWLSELLRKVIPVVQKFNRFYTSSNHAMGFTVAILHFKDQDADNIIEKFSGGLLDMTKNASEKDSKTEFNIYVRYDTFIKGGINSFSSYGNILTIDFSRYEYTVRVNEFLNSDKNTFKESNEQKAFVFDKRLLHKPFTEAEIEHAAIIIGNTLYEHIDYYSNKINTK